MGNVKDRYFKYAENGDQYVGRCLCLLPILNVELASSPPIYSSSADEEWINEMVITQFFALRGVTEFGLLLRMCLASLLYHTDWIMQFLGVNHVVRNTSACFRDAIQLKRIKDDDWIKVTYPWSSPQLIFSGIPPYCSLLQHIAEVRSEQKGKLFFVEFYLLINSLTKAKISTIHLLTR
jgi:hypothetical protein